jgi:hypothetical protein
MWTGAGWEPLKSNLADAVLVKDFVLEPSDGNLNISEGTLDIYVGQTVTFTASKFVPDNASYPGVSWTIEGADWTRINNATKSLAACSITGRAVGQSKLTVTSLDGYSQKTVTINVKVCLTAPDAPKGITFSKTDEIRINEEITATATPEVPEGGVIPTTYNWTPSAYFDITDGAGTRIITLKAKAKAASIAVPIKVNAANTCGTSANYTNETALSILDCSGVPELQGEIRFDKTSVAMGSTFTATINVVDGAKSYTWTIPDGLTPTGTQTTTAPTITLTGATANITVDAGTIKVRAHNDCGSSDDKISTLAVTVRGPVCAYTVLEGAYSGPETTELDGIGNLRPTMAILKTYGFKSIGDLCLAPSALSAGTYRWAAAEALCRSFDTDDVKGWRLPNLAEMMAITPNYNALGFNDGQYDTGTWFKEGHRWRWMISKVDKVPVATAVEGTDVGLHVRCVRVAD